MPFECICGFSCGTSHALKSHLRRGQLSGANHLAVAGRVSPVPLATVDLPATADGRVRLLFVRHGESANKSMACQTHVEDAPLSPLGYRQAEALGAALGAQLSPSQTLVVVSPMRRALLTAAPLISRLGLARGRVICHGELWEWRGAHPAYPGRSAAATEADKQMPSVRCECFGEGGTTWQFHGHGHLENETDMRRRAHSFRRWLHAQMPRRLDGDTVHTAVIVGHLHFFDLLLQILLKGTAEDWYASLREYALRNAAVTEVMYDFGTGCAILGTENSVVHLKERGVAVTGGAHDSS